MAKNDPKCAQFVSNSPKTKNGPYLGLRGSNPNSEGTYFKRNPQLFVASNPHNHPMRRLDSRISGHSLELEATRAAHTGRQRWIHKGPQGEKSDLLQTCS